MPPLPPFKICALIEREKIKTKHQGLATKEKPRKDKIPTAVLLGCCLWAEARCSRGQHPAQWFLGEDGVTALEVFCDCWEEVEIPFTESTRCSGTELWTQTYLKLLLSLWRWVSRPRGQPWCPRGWARGCSASGCGPQCIEVWRWTSGSAAGPLGRHGQQWGEAWKGTGCHLPLEASRCAAVSIYEAERHFREDGMKPRAELFRDPRALPAWPLPRRTVANSRWGPQQPVLPWVRPWQTRATGNWGAGSLTLKAI